MHLAAFRRLTSYTRITEVNRSRAAVSIPSNIAEGQGRCSKGEFRQFLGIARGSLLEVETQIHIAHRLALLSKEKQNELLSSTGEVLRMLNGLWDSMASKPHDQLSVVLELETRNLKLETTSVASPPRSLLPHSQSEKSTSTASQSPSLRRSP